MNDPAFDRLLDRFRERAAPPVPREIDAHVLRAVRSRAPAEMAVTFWNWLDGVVPQLRFVMAAGALALIAATATTRLLVFEPAPDRISSARVALGFDAFARSPEFPFDRKSP